MNQVSKQCVAALILTALSSAPCLFVSAQQGAKGVGSDERTAPALSARAVPFDLYHNRAYLQLSVNGSRPLWFVLDSGASFTVINVERAKELGLTMKDEGEVANFGAGEGKTKIASVKVASFNFAGVTWPGRNVLALPLDYLEPYEGRKLDGILGYDFLKRFVVEVDYPHRTISLYDPAGYAYSGGGAIIPIEEEGKWIFVRGTITVAGRAPIETRLQIDSGARGALELRRPFVEKHRLLASVSMTFPGIRYGVGGDAPQLLGRVESLRVGPFPIQKPVTGFSQAKKGETAAGEVAGTINGNILRRFRVIFDYARGRMVWEPGPDAAAPYEYDMSGTLLKADGHDFKTITVYRVFAHSPAVEAGLHEGDVITAIDGVPTTGLVLEDVERMFQQEGREYQLSVRHGADMEEIKIKMRRLV